MIYFIKNSSKMKLSKELKNGTEIFSRLSRFLSWIKNSENIVLPNNYFVYLNFNVNFEFLGQFIIKTHKSFFNKGVNNYIIEHKTY